MNSNATRFRPTASDAMQRFLADVLPGASTAMVRLRAQIYEFACDPLADRLLLEGPFGSGKSALARLVGFLKWVAPMRKEYAEQVIENARFRSPGYLEPLQMSWFVELAMTGLVAELAAAQLFGTVKSAYTGAKDQEGVFELAMFGRNRANPPAGAQTTGGMVFFDEIGDLPAELQPRLLPVLSGGTFYRLGAEGQQEYALTFEGIAIAATWRALGPGDFRPDLLSRIAGFVIPVPALSARMDDFDGILDSQERWVESTARNRIERLKRADQRSADRENLEQFAKAIRRLNHDERDRLRNVDWDKYGNLRGVLRAVEQTIAGQRSVEEVIEDLKPISAIPTLEERDAGSGAFERLLALADGSRSILAQVRDLEHERRVELHDLLKTNRGARAALCKKMNVTDRQLKAQLYQLPRRRVSE